MTDYRPRLFASDADIEHVGERFLARALPKEEWTHEAHLATTTWLLLRRPQIDVDRELPGLIRRYNESVGGVNSDTEGYHETITLASIAAARAVLESRPASEPLHEVLDRLMAGPLGRSDWPLAYWTKARLFSPAARLGWLEPDLQPFDAEVFS